MALTYFKRFRMEFDLARQSFEPPALPEGYQALSWNDSLLEWHAEAKYLSFCFELDGNVFPCLAEREGCRRLMKEISLRENFVPEATWLLVRRPAVTSLPNLPTRLRAGSRLEPCGTIQGLCDNQGYGAVQNLGVTRPHRGRMLGAYLLCQALEGFRRAGLDRAYLEVTAQNTSAVRLYQRLGFRVVKTVYKAADVAYA
jgi:ribosomal protein S18 acetylase RimI-like enzyme